MEKQGITYSNLTLRLAGGEVKIVELLKETEKEEMFVKIVFLNLVELKIVERVVLRRELNPLTL